MNKQDFNIYIPEYNPSKYKKAVKISKLISIIFLITMLLGVTIILLTAYLDRNSFLVNINGVPKKDWGWIIILLGIVIAIFGLSSLFVYILYIRLKQAHAVFCEPDENKRLQMHLKFHAVAIKAAKAHGTCAAINISSNLKK